MQTSFVLGSHILMNDCMKCNVFSGSTKAVAIACWPKHDPLSTSCLEWPLSVHLACSRPGCSQFFTKQGTLIQHQPQSIQGSLDYIYFASEKVCPTPCLNLLDLSILKMCVCVWVFFFSSLC